MADVNAEIINRIKKHEDRIERLEVIETVAPGASHAAITLGNYASRILTLTGQALTTPTVAAHKAYMGPVSGADAAPDWRAPDATDLPGTISADHIGERTGGHGVILDNALTAANGATVVGTLLVSIGAEKVTNGTFPTDTSGWTAYLSTLSVNSGHLRVTNDGGTNYGYQLITGLIVGHRYKVTYNYVGKTGSAAYVFIGTAAAFGGAGHNSYFNLGTGYGNLSTGLTTRYFIATATTFNIYLGSNGTAGQYADFDDISLVEMGTLSTDDVLATGNITALGNISAAGINYRSSGTGITAATTHAQWAATGLTKDINEVTTCANASDAIGLPSAVAGMQLFVKNSGAQVCAVWPASGDNIMGAGVDTVSATTIAAGKTHMFMTFDTTNWHQIVLD